MRLLDSISLQILGDNNQLVGFCDKLRNSLNLAFVFSVLRTGIMCPVFIQKLIPNGPYISKIIAAEWLWPRLGSRIGIGKTLKNFRCFDSIIWVSHLNRCDDTTVLAPSNLPTWNNFSDKSRAADEILTVHSMSHTRRRECRSMERHYKFLLFPWLHRCMPSTSRTFLLENFANNYYDLKRKQCTWRRRQWQQVSWFVNKYSLFVSSLSRVFLPPPSPPLKTCEMEMIFVRS